MAGVLTVTEGSDSSQTDREPESLTLRSVDFRAGPGWNGDQRRDWEEEA